MIACAMLAAWLAVPALQGQIYVDVNSGDDADTGLGGWDNAVATISNGVARAGEHAQSVVLVATGTYSVVSNIMLTSALTLRSWNAGTPDPADTVIDGGGVTRCLYLNHAGAVVDGFTFTGGNGKGDASVALGGAVYINTLGGTLTNCSLYTNSADTHGGAIYMASAAGYVNNCRIAYNCVTNPSSAYGGGIYIYAGGTVSNSLLAFNTNIASSAYRGGGGIYIRGNSASADACKLIDCVISNNFANQGGGGMLLEYKAHITGNAIADNSTSNQGGGIFFNSIQQGAIFANNVVSNNYGNGGGGCYIWPSTSSGGVLVSNCVFANNSALQYGGAVYAYVANATSYTNTKMIITHSQLHGNLVTSTSDSRGGGAIYWDAPGLIECCVFSNNHAAAGIGGALFLKRVYELPTPEELIVRNCLITTNLARYYGGAVIQSSAPGKPIRLESCTIAGNTATNYAGGLAACDGLTLTNTIVYHNNAPVDENIRPTGAGYILGYCCTYPTNQLTDAAAMVNVTTNDPGFIQWDAGNFKLAAGSPCVDAGIVQDWMAAASDLEGQPRVDFWRRRPDMGCYERLSQGSLLLLR